MLDGITGEELGNVINVFSQAGNMAMQAFRVLRELKLGKATPKHLNTALTDYQKENPFMFKGNKTDLSYFWKQDSMSVSQINNLDNPLREKVRLNFNKYIDEGLLTLSSDKTRLTITTAGKTAIQDPAFVEQALKKDLEYNEAVTRGAEELQKELEETRFTPSKDNPVKTATETVKENIAEAQGANITKDAATKAQAVNITKDTAQTITKTGAAATKAGTTVAAGASTMGIGAIASVGYELLSSGFKIVKGR